MTGVLAESGTAMPPIQRYISDELSHFFGARDKTEEEGYERLVTILQAGRLLAGGRGEDAGEMMIATAGARALCGDKMFVQDLVCFCDIPVADFGIHMQKYGKFGIGFAKSWLIQRGANPVFYVAAGTSPIVVPKGNPPRPREEVFNQEVDDLYLSLFKLTNETDGMTLADHVHGILSFFLQPHIFAFIKCFDPGLRDDDPGNYYMEREWRGVGSVAFALSDVRRIVLPEGFATRLRADVPAYSGQMEFTPA
ncbi:MAG: abortive infection system antitoxin AbiGi family protein [Actinomycetota bacterium]|nr:abortive infection system antitoxin AbiGi family protein [Actinomycetota bacterium]